MSRTACCSVGLGGPYEIPESGDDHGCKYPWHICWLPKGYAVTPNDYVICLVAEPPDEDWEKFGLGKGSRPPLIEAICKTIENYMLGRQAREVMRICIDYQMDDGLLRKRLCLSFYSRNWRWSMPI
jgi:hypothetical protein